MTDVVIREGKTAGAALTVTRLSTSEFSEWDALVVRSPHGTVFHTSWWLEATGSQLEILGGRNAAGVLVAGIPLPSKRRFGMRLLHTPRLTPYLGPVFDLSSVCSIAAQYALMRDGGEVLARAVSGFDSLDYDLAPMCPDLQGFLWAGYSVWAGYTYWLEAGTDLATILSSMPQKTRNKLARAERSGITVEQSDNFEAFFHLVRKSFARQHMPLPYDPALPQRLWSAARSRQQANLYLARTPSGNLAAGALIVHDQRNSYYLMGGDDEEFRALGVGNLVQWHAMRQALGAGRSYDFEGSHFRGVERYFRSWGTTARPLFMLVKTGSLRGACARAYLDWKMRRQFRRARS